MSAKGLTFLVGSGPGDPGLLTLRGAECVRAADRLHEKGLDVGLINARFVKPIDRETARRAIQQYPFVVTVEEAALAGGFGSAMLEIAADTGLDAGQLRRLGLPDRFVEHGNRDELLADLGLDAEGIAQTCLELARRSRKVDDHAPSTAQHADHATKS